MKYLGTLTIRVEMAEDGRIGASHQTDLAPSLALMQAAMSNEEKLAAMAIRRAACQEAATFFARIEDPDADVVIIDEAG